MPHAGGSPASLGAKRRASLPEIRYIWLRRSINGLKPVLAARQPPDIYEV